MSTKTELVKACAVTAELTGTEMTDAAAEVMVDDLAVYPPEQVFSALTRCRRELRGRLTLSEIIARLDDGRPGPEEAWAEIPKDEADSVVWTAEMRTAFGAAQPLLADGDEIAARMTFKEVYTAEITRARAERRPPRWELSQGYNHQGRHDAHAGRKLAITKAIERGRINEQTAVALLPDYHSDDPTDAPRLTHDGNATPASEALSHIEEMKRLTSKQGAA